MILLSVIILYNCTVLSVVQSGVISNTSAKPAHKLPQQDDITSRIVYQQYYNSSSTSKYNISILILIVSIVTRVVRGCVARVISERTRWTNTSQTKLTYVSSLAR